MEINLPEQVKESKSENVCALIDQKAQEADDVKTAINLLATREALRQEENVDKLINEKAEELRNDAEAKRVKAEAERINEEAKKVVAEKEKQLEEFDKQISARQKEVEELRAESDKAQAFFEANAEILKYIGVRTKKSLGVMKSLMAPATLLFTIVRILLFPITLCGVIIEALIDIVGSVCGEIKHNALKMIISVGLIVLIVGVLVAVYIFGGKLIGI